MDAVKLSSDIGLKAFRLYELGDDCAREAMTAVVAVNPEVMGWLRGLLCAIDKGTSIEEHQIERLNRENRTLKAALTEIANHPHNSYDHSTNQSETSNYGIGCADGHRCAATIAKRVL